MESDCPGVTTFLVIWTGIHNLYRESPYHRIPTTSGGASRFADAARQAGATDVLTSQAVDQASPLPAAIPHRHRRP